MNGGGCLLFSAAGQIKRWREERERERCGPFDRQGIKGEENRQSPKCQQDTGRRTEKENMKRKQKTVGRSVSGWVEREVFRKEGKKKEGGVRQEEENCG